jgi:hypothetical protein
MSTLFADLKAALERITIAAGYSQNLQAVYDAPAVAQDKPPLPYALLRPAALAPTAEAGSQALDVLTIEVELVMQRTSTPDQLLAAVHDVLRAIGYRSLDDDLPYLLEAELISTEFNLPSAGIASSGFTMTLGVASPATY